MSVKEAFASMAQSILKMIAKMIAEMIAFRIVSSFLGAFFPTSAAFTSAGGISASGVAGGMPEPVNPLIDPSGRTGGIFKPMGYAAGGIARGRDAGYPAILHGTEAVVPLPNGNAIPVEMRGNNQSNNVVVNVNIDGNGNAQQNSAGGDSQQGVNLGKAIAAAVQKELQNQKRSGGILSPYGAA